MHLLPSLLLAAASVPADVDAMTRLAADHADCAHRIAIVERAKERDDADLSQR